MSNANTSRLGLVNNTGTAYDALFLKVFSGEVLASFGRENKMLGMTTVRTIGSGKSAQFPVTGTIASSYHTVGNEILGTALPIWHEGSQARRRLGLRVAIGE